MKKRVPKAGLRPTSDEVKKVNWDAIDLPSPSPTREENRSGEIIDNHRQPSIDYDSAISITAQTFAVRIPDLSQADLDYVDRLLWLEKSYRIDPSLVPSYRRELGSIDADSLPNQSNDLRVPYGYTEYKRVPKGDRDYYYYYWRHRLEDGRLKSHYLGSDRNRAQDKIDRMTS